MENCSDTQSSQRINRPLAVADSGLDVHKDTTAVSVAILDPLCDIPVVEDFGSFANRPTQIARLAETLGVNSPTSYTGSTERATGMANFPVRNLKLRTS